jgi:Na+/melibiose symporter-like transporter
MLTLRYFLDRRFSTASGGISLIYFAMFGTFFLITQYFQLVLGYGTLEAGLKQGPMALVMVAVAPQTPRLAARIGSNRSVALGLAGVSLGLLLFSRMQPDTVYPVLLLPMITLATGMALTISPLTASIMSAVPMGKAGVGSAMNDTTRELGGALGVAVLGSLVASRYDSRLSSALTSVPASVRPAARSSLSGALRVARQMGGAPGAQLANAARHAYVSGMSVAALVAACVAAVASVVVYRLLPAHTPHGRIPASDDLVRAAADSPLASAGDVSPVQVD